MQRRSFLHLSVYTAAVLAVPFVSGCDHKALEAEAEPFFFSQLAAKKTIIKTGMLYRKAHAAEDDKDRLVKLLVPGETRPDENTIRTMLDNQVKADFNAGKIAVVNGWVLSLTEARQCALYSILHF